MAAHAAEAKRLAGLTEDQFVKTHLLNLAEQWAKETTAPQTGLQNNANETSVQAPAATVVTKTLYKPITNYAWDQTSKSVKLYVSFSDIDKLPTENIQVNFEDEKVEAIIVDARKSHHQLLLQLAGPINPESSSFKLRPGRLVITMKKKDETNWPGVTLADKKKKEEAIKPPSSKSKDKDPASGIVDMMKDLYDKGDDEMKRTIAKAWADASNKKD
eukprot:m.9645 g.9645  ORF g.9645 m.9645 type:complete len:216 (-) comp7235_c0_seq1:194-841(-)